MEKNKKVLKSWEERREESKKRAERARKITSHIKKSLSEIVLENRGYR